MVLRQMQVPFWHGTDVALKDCIERGAEVQVRKALLTSVCLEHWGVGNKLAISCELGGVGEMSS